MSFNIIENSSSKSGFMFKKCRICFNSQENLILLEDDDYEERANEQEKKSVTKTIKKMAEFLDIQFKFNSVISQYICKECFENFECIEEFFYLWKKTSIKFENLNKTININLNGSIRNETDVLDVEDNNGEEIHLTEMKQEGSILTVKEFQEHNIPTSTICYAYDNPGEEIELTKYKQEGSPVTGEELEEQNTHTSMICYEYEYGLKEDRLDLHQEEIDDITLNCNFCTLQFGTIEHLLEHSEKFHLDSAPYCCEKCFRHFRTSSIRDKHFQLNSCKENSEKHTEFTKNSILRIVESNSSDGYDTDYFDESMTTIYQDLPLVNKGDSTSKRKINEGYKFYNNKYHCNYCQKVIKNVTRMRIHLNKFHPECGVHYDNLTKVCEICGVLKETSEMKDHLNAHLGIKTYYCEFCDESFSQQTKYRFHRLVEHIDKRIYKCDICEEEIISRPKYMQHMKKHESTTNRLSKGTYKCPFCIRTFRTFTSLKIHGKSHNKPLDCKHICEICSQPFKRSDHLKMHVDNVHLNLKPFTCDHCSKTFTTRWMANNHMKSNCSANSARSQFKCDICEKLFNFKSSMKRHKQMRHHVNTANYKCEICGESFLLLRVLEEHEQTHNIDEDERTKIATNIYNQLKNSNSVMIGT